MTADEEPEELWEERPWQDTLAEMQRELADLRASIDRSDRRAKKRCIPKLYDDGETRRRPCSRTHRLMMTKTGCGSAKSAPERYAHCHRIMLMIPRNGFKRIRRCNHLPPRT